MGRSLERSSRVPSIANVFSFIGRLHSEIISYFFVFTKAVLCQICRNFYASINSIPTFFPPGTSIFPQRDYRASPSANGYYRSARFEDNTESGKSCLDNIFAVWSTFRFSIHDYLWQCRLESPALAHFSVSRWFVVADLQWHDNQTELPLRHRRSYPLVLAGK